MPYRAEKSPIYRPEYLVRSILCGQIPLCRRAAEFNRPSRGIIPQNRGTAAELPREAIAPRLAASGGYALCQGRVAYQAEGRTVDRGAAFLGKLSRRAVSLKPSGMADGHLHALLLKSLTRLRDARQQRLLAAGTAISAVVWIVMRVGGLAFGSFLGVPSLAMHVVMSAVLAISGVLVLILIIALSNPFRGDFRVSTYPYDQVLAKIQAAITWQLHRASRGKSRRPRSIKV